MPDFESLITSQDATIKQAWEQINRNNHKTVFVCDHDRKLLGVLTDGDVRRWILSDRDLADNVCEAMEHRPATATEQDDRDKIAELLLKLKIECVPVVSPDMTVQDVRTWMDCLPSTPVSPVRHRLDDVPVVVMAGGMGTRLKPFTKILPKPLIPVGDKPIIELIMDRFQAQGASEFYISVFHKARMIKAYFQDDPNDYQVTFLQESEPLGTAGALRILKSDVSSTFFVTNCDILIEADYGEILESHRERQADITLVCAMQHSQLSYGVVEIEVGGSLRRITEKPVFDHLVNTGLYVVEPKVLDLIVEGEAIDMPALIEKAQNAGCRAVVHPIADQDWIDIGQLDQYQLALKKLEEF